MKILSSVLSLLIAAPSFAQVAAVRVAAPVAPSLSGLGAAPSAIGPSLTPLSAPSLSAAPLAASLPLSAAPAPVAA